ncbi:MAG: histidine kinase [Nocardioides sp.]
MFGVRALMDRNQQLVYARQELAQRAVTEERSRFSRDLHDILGHTLTVVTVKAELAGRLLELDPERARAELADVERLSRDALADVRRAVGGYREPSLAAELVRAREALGSAGIADDLPTSVDDVPAELRELFAWTIREGSPTWSGTAQPPDARCGWTRGAWLSRTTAPVRPRRQWLDTASLGCGSGRTLRVRCWSSAARTRAASGSR